MACTHQKNAKRVVAPITTNALHLGEALDDIMAGFAKWRIWVALSWQEFIATYRRSFFGLAWVILSFAGFVFVKLVIFSSLIATDDAKFYNAYLLVGLYLWIYFSTVMNSAPDTFISASGWIRSEPLPFSIYILKAIMREFYNFALTFAVVIAAFLDLNFPIHERGWLSLFAVVFFFMNAFAIKLLIGLVSARFRDIAHFIKALMLPLMFLTPIFWLPSQMPGLMKYLWWNPFYHYLEIFRMPLLTGEFPMQSWIFVSIVFAIVSLSAFLLFARFRQRIVFWF